MAKRRGKAGSTGRRKSRVFVPGVFLLGELGYTDHSLAKIGQLE